MTGPNRRVVIEKLARTIAAELENSDEVQAAIGVLQQRGKQLRRLSVSAHETLSRQFLQQRYAIFGELPCPPLEFVNELEVWHEKSGIDFAESKPYTKKWTARISKARFVKLGRRSLSRYVELEVAVDEIIPAKDREYYGFKGETLPVYCTLASLINAGPRWVMDTVTKIRIARARALAAQATNNIERGAE